MSNIYKIPNKLQRDTSDLSATILSNLHLAARYSDIAHQHDELFDHTGFVMSCDKFLEHARLVSKALVQLREKKGVLG